MLVLLNEVYFSAWYY